MVERPSREAETRLAAKVILVDQHNRVLLFRGGDPASPGSETWWFPPGGGLEPGETAEDGARREVYEETGLPLGDLGAIVYHRTAAFTFNGTPMVSEEDYYVVHVDHFEIATEGWTELERAVVEEHRWWPLVELRTTARVVYPETLVDLVEQFGR